MNDVTYIFVFSLQNYVLHCVTYNGGVITRKGQGKMFTHDDVNT